MAEELKLDITADSSKLEKAAAFARKVMKDLADDADATTRQQQSAVDAKIKQTMSVATAKASALEKELTSKRQELSQISKQIDEAERKLTSKYENGKEYVQAIKENKLRSLTQMGTTGFFNEYDTSNKVDAAYARELKNDLRVILRLKKEEESAQNKINRGVSKQIVLETQASARVDQLKLKKDAIARKSYYTSTTGTVAGTSSAIDRILPSSLSSLGYIAKVGKAWAAAAREIATSTAILGAGLAAVVGPGIKFNATMEQAKLGMAGTFSSMAELNGQRLTFEQGMGAAEKVMRRLRIEAARTSATMEDLVTTYQGILAPGLGAEMNPSELLRFASIGVNTAKAMGLPSQQFVQELRDLIQGGIRPQSSQIATSLGLTDKDVLEARNSTEGLFKFLMDKMEGFAEMSGHYIDIIMGKWSLLTEMFTQASAKLAEPFMPYLKATLTLLTDSIATINEAGDDITVNPSLIAAFAELKAIIDATIEEFGTFNGEKFSFNQDTIETWETFKETVADVWETFKILTKAFLEFIPVLKDLGEIFHFFMQIIRPIMEIFDELFIKTGLLRIAFEAFVGFLANGVITKAVTSIYRVFSKLRMVVDAAGVSFRAMRRSVADALMELTKLWEYVKEAYPDAARMIRSFTYNLVLAVGGAGVGIWGERSRKKENPVVPPAQKRIKEQNVDLEQVKARNTKIYEEFRLRLKDSLEILKAGLQAQLAEIKRHFAKIEMLYEQNQITASSYYKEAAQKGIAEAQAKVTEQNAEIKATKEELAKIATKLKGEEGSDEWNKSLAKLSEMDRSHYSDSLKKLQKQEIILQTYVKDLADAQRALEQVNTLSQASKVTSSAQSVEISGSSIDDIRNAVVEGAKADTSKAYGPDITNPNEIVCTELVVNNWDQVTGLISALKEKGYDTTYSNKYGDDDSGIGAELNRFVPALVQFAKDVQAWHEWGTYTPRKGDAVVGSGDGVDPFGHVVMARGDGGFIGAQNASRGVIEGDALENAFGGAITGVIDFGKVMEAVTGQTEQFNVSIAKVNKNPTNLPIVDTKTALEYRKAIQSMNDKFYDYLSQVEELFGTSNAMQKAKIRAKFEQDMAQVAGKWDDTGMGKAVVGAMQKLMQYQLDNLDVSHAQKIIETENKNLEHIADAMALKLTVGHSESLENLGKAYQESVGKIKEQIDILANKAKNFKAQGLTDAAEKCFESLKNAMGSITNIFDRVTSEINAEYDHAEQMLASRKNLTTLQRENAENNLARDKAAKLYAVDVEKLAVLKAERDKLYTQLAEHPELAVDIQPLIDYNTQLQTTTERLKEVHEQNMKVQGSLGKIHLAAKQAFEDGLLEFMTTGITECESLGDAFREMALSILKSIQEVTAKEIVGNLMGSFFGPSGEKKDQPRGTIDIGTQTDAINQSFAMFNAQLGGINTQITSKGVELQTALQTLVSAISTAAANISSMGMTGGSTVAAATGGFIRGPGTATSDSIPAMLSNGEFVVKAAAVKQYGRNMLERINNGSFANLKVRVPKFARGGYVGTTGAKATEEFGANFAANVSPRINVSNYVDGEKILESSGKNFIRNEIKKENIRHAKFYATAFGTLG